VKNRSRLSFVLYSLALAAAVSLAAWTVPPAPQGFKLNGNPAQGKAVYEKNCVLCHGPAGKGDGPMSSGLSPRPKDLTDKAVTGKRSDWEVYLVVRDGGKVLGLSPQMFSYKTILKDQEISDVAAFVRTLAK